MVFRRYAYSPGFKKQKNKKQICSPALVPKLLNNEIQLRSGLKMSAFGFDALKLLFIIL